MRNKFKNLSDSIIIFDRNLPEEHQPIPTWAVKEFLKREDSLAFEFVNKILNANTKSKNFIEIMDFNYHFNEFLEERKKLVGDKFK